ncbi:hypothetical protein DSECCO2_653060 [anaerobic digester metagenome]
MTGCCSKYYLIDNGSGFLWMFFQIIGEQFRYKLIHRTHNFGVAQLGFGLTFELWLLYLAGDNGCKPFPEAVTADVKF